METPKFNNSIIAPTIVVGSVHLNMAEGVISSDLQWILRALYPSKVGVGFITASSINN